MKIPSKKFCFELIRKMEMLDHIVDHSMQVCRVALFLTDGWNVRETILNRDLIFASALLHDITKTRSFDTGEDHAETGGRLLENLSYPEVGKIIAQHVKLRNYDGKNGFPTEAEIVNYADKRVLHDKIVTFPQRMEYIVERYGHVPNVRNRLHRIWKRSLELEKKIFSGLQIDPDNLAMLLAGAPEIDWQDFPAG